MFDYLSHIYPEPIYFMNNIGQKLWSFCHILRHDGVDYGDYIEQLTFLLFLKMADERGLDVSDNYSWPTLLQLTGTDLRNHYAETLSYLEKQPGLLSKIYRNAVLHITNPENLQKLIKLIDGIDWTGMDIDVKGEAFEDLLERSASEGKKGAGQYFTPRPLIHSIVRLMKPDPRESEDFSVSDPACGTAGFLVAAREWLHQEVGNKLPKKVAERVRNNTYFGYELVPRPARLAMMNLFLHDVTTEVYIGDTIYNDFDGHKYSCILANPPFGTKGVDKAPKRDDFPVKTTNKQLNFIQHIHTALKPGGRAAIVLPDNVLFEDKAGQLFQELLESCNLHTILRLPQGTFTPYAQGVKANVLFLQKGPATENVWIYDARANVPGFTKNARPLTDKFFEPFEVAYGSDPNGQAPRLISERFRSFSIDEIKARRYNLDITWLRDESLGTRGTGDPAESARRMLTSLETAMEGVKKLITLLEKKQPVTA